MKQKTDKRQRLIESGKILFSRQGFSVTTLEHISALADVPLGNVYYYFKTKGSIATAALSQSKQLQEQQLEELNKLPSAKERLLAIIERAGNGVEDVIKFGDPIGSMCQELRKMEGDLGQNAAKIIEELLAWCEAQFKELGNGKNPRQQAINLISCLQGGSLLTLTLKKEDALAEVMAYACESL